MAKHDFWFRLQVVQSYRAGDKGYVGVAREHGLDKATVRKWVQSYELHGEAGLKPKHSRYSAQFKLDVLQSIAQEQLSHTRACARFGLRGGTGVIAAWQRQYHEGGLEALKAKRKGRPPNMKTNKPASASVPSNRAQSEMPDAQRSLQDVLKENEYLRAEVAYLKKLRALRQEKEQAAQKKRG